MDGDPGFRYLNLENQWPGFEYAPGGLALREDGTLGLAPLPRVGASALTVPSVQPVGVPYAVPAGFAVDSAGTFYVTAPALNKVLRCDPCSGTCEPLPCLSAQEGTAAAGGLLAPSGLSIGPESELYLVETGRHRVKILEPATYQTVGLLGQPDPFGPPKPSAEPGGLSSPWAIAADRLGRFYILDYGNRRIQRFAASGRVDRGFWETLRSAIWIKLGEPIAIAVGMLEGEERLLILDRSPKQLVICGLDGRIDAAATSCWRGALDQPGLGLDAPATLAVVEDTVLVGDALDSTLLAFDTRGHLRGPVEALEAPATAFATGPRGEQWVYQAGAGIVAELIVGERYRRSGGLLAGPFAVSDRATRWHSVQASIDPLPLDTHLRLYTLTSDRLDGSGASRPPYPWLGLRRSGLIQADDPNLAPRDAWRALPMDADAGLILNETGRYLWLAGTLHGDGKQTPALQQIRVDFDHEGWLRHLPEVYRRHAGEASLERILALLEHSLGDFSASIDALPASLRPGSAPDTDPDPWLQWLGDWIGVQLDDAWDEEKRRRVLAEAFSSHQRRGRADALRQGLARHGFMVRIEEPAKALRLWSLDEACPLGFATMLASAKPDGAVLGSTATLGQSDLIASEEYGAPLFQGSAHGFRVVLYAADDADAEILRRLRQLLDREKPAHTAYEIDVVTPRMRLGVQARLGLDSVVAGPLPQTQLDTAHSLGSQSVLSRGRAGPSGPTLDSGAALGQDIRLE